MSMPTRRCEDCGRALTPCPARWDGEDTYVGYYACPCEEARTEDTDLEECRTLSDSSIGSEA